MRNNKKRPLRAHSLSWFNGDVAAKLRHFVDLLNSSQPDEGIDSIRELMRNLKNVEDAARYKHFPKSEVVDFTWSEAKLRDRGFSRETIKRFRQISHAFDRSRFKLSPAFFTETNNWSFALVPMRSKSAAQHRNILLAIIQGLWEAGLLPLIRECLICQRWYLAIRNAQRFCSPACRKKHYVASDEGKRKRRQYMRNHRRNLKREKDAMQKLGKPGRSGRQTQTRAIR
jgi:hypothetical protein